MKIDWTLAGMITLGALGGAGYVGDTIIKANEKAELRAEAANCPKIPALRQDGRPSINPSYVPR